MNKKPDSKLWGVLGKQQTYYSPQQFLAGKTKTPLNASPFESWDAKRSKYNRIDGIDARAQQGGVVPQITATPVPDVSPTPTPSPTFTPSPTPSSTPYILPETPALWYDATNVGSIDFITSGGTDFVSAWRSIGTFQKVTTGTTINTMPIWSGSSQMPGSPKIIRWDKRSTVLLRQFLSQRFDMTPIPQSGFTVFQVFAKPDGLNYTTAANGMAFSLFFCSGNTAGGFVVPAPLNYANSINTAANNTILQTIAQANPNVVNTQNSITAFSATQLDNKFIYTQVVPFGNTGLPFFELNQSGGTQQLQITGQTNSSFNAIAIGIGFNTTGTILQSAVSPGIELCEIQIYNRVLSPAEQDQVQEYLRDKWRYDEWASPVPTPTPTATQP